MPKVPEKSQEATTGEELGAQLLQSVREMKAGLRGRVYVPGGGDPKKSNVPEGCRTSSE
ncbi:MAG TPA: hypothetical protein VGS22_28110 [Thermoanaerobaculia bacterium]|jgi:hypothetical protein|nr:hypothetical protein [Thermoanaerobaculia bacterium]